MIFFVFSVVALSLCNPGNFYLLNEASQQYNITKSIKCQGGPQTCIKMLGCLLELFYVKPVASSHHNCVLWGKSNSFSPLMATNSDKKFCFLPRGIVFWFVF